MSLDYSIPIPGGRADFWKRAELPPRKQRILDTHFVPQQAKAKQLVDNPESPLSKDEAAALLELNEVGAWCLLKSWTLTDQNGNQRALPESADAFLDLERPLYDALTNHAAKILAEEVAPFSVGELETGGGQSPTQA